MSTLYEPTADAGGYALAAFQLARTTLEMLVDNGTLPLDTAITQLEKMKAGLPDIGGADEVFQAVINQFEFKRARRDT